MAMTGKELGQQRAFPSSRIEEQVSAKVAYQEGMTKREIFAAFALMGYLANPETFGSDQINYWSRLRADELCEELAGGEQS